MPSSELRHLRTHAISQSLFPPTTLRAAIARLGFLQADPIRSPARAQDLILRLRVNSYGAGDLERKYASLDIEEDYLYAYGFLPRPVWQLLHPRDASGLSHLEKKVLAVVRRFGRMHPNELQAHFGVERVVNAWGGYSKATTRALEDLHYRGLLRIAGRENGIRIYETAPARQQSLSPAERLRKLILCVASILEPAPQKSLQAAIARFRRLGNPRSALNEMLKTGKLEKQTIDGIDYVWPARRSFRQDPQRRVRFLAPFDPLVWDRYRFEHLWGWPYRFEAYTPVKKRVRGYYAMPLLWIDRVVGWVNAQITDGQLKIELGYAEKRPSERDFSSELENEIEKLKAFLHL